MLEVWAYSLFTFTPTKPVEQTYKKERAYFAHGPKLTSYMKTKQGQATMESSDISQNGIASFCFVCFSNLDTPTKILMENQRPLWIFQ